MINFFFKKNFKLLNNNLILNYKNSITYTNKYFKIIKIINNLEYARLGLIIKKKHIKFSHDRNKFKRIAIESFRYNQYLLPILDFIIFSKNKLYELNNYKFIINLEKIWNF
ncbi:MAG: ribonuclease P protein component [Enterobacteriaceae bacterium PSpicST2]|nr:MAG: ribonuclease P protein component [Enterobacteriaceae bacterium PSpicST2]WMC19093.1 MAG: ribonuclease P protein component [Enterobacteriaceae bacterium PSpicST1]